MGALAPSELQIATPLERAKNEDLRGQSEFGVDTTEEQTNRGSLGLVFVNRLNGDLSSPQESSETLPRLSLTSSNSQQLPQLALVEDHEIIPSPI